MRDSRDARLPQWLRASRGKETQEQLAADVERVTGWHITRDRYSKYESGSLPIGPKTEAHFVDYWASRGVTGPDAAAPDEPEPDLLTALRMQADTITALVEELRLSRIQQHEATMALLQAVGALQGPAQDRAGTRDDTPREASADTPPVR